jgi:S-adenosylmethionine:tRNA ribosyltransferase-isomerase
MGGKYELFLVLNERDGMGDISCFTGRPFGYGKPKKLKLEKDRNVSVTVYKNKEDGITYLKNDFDNIFDFLDKYGETPVPHYLEDKNNRLDEKYVRERYQTIFADKGKSVAAPTASLHFTEEVFKKLSSKNIQKYFVNLDIGRGTFSNLKENNLVTNTLHKERYFIPKEVCEKLQDKDNANIIVGTTACRTVESFGKTGSLSGDTDIFIHDDFTFKYTDILITNFHQPETSLMALVASFLKFKKSKKSVLDLYKIAIEKEYAFFSFGDSMLIL